VSTKRQLLFAKRWRVQVMSDNTGSPEDSLQTFLLSTQSAVFPAGGR
jgi:hypothetical protein